MNSNFRPIPTSLEPWFGADGKPLVYEYLFGLDKAARTPSGGGDAATLNGQAGSYYLDWANFTGVPSTFPPSAHTHPQSEVTNLVADLAGKQPLSTNLTAFASKAAPSGVVVGTTDSQALTSKDLTSGTNTFPTFNQNTTGSAAKLTTARNIDGQAFDGSANITVIAPGTHAATSKTTPVDADELPLVDSAASNVLKKLTWANLKATIKNYFDTLYVAIPGAWTAYTPTVTAGSGSFTAASATGRWQQIGKTIFGSVKVTITTNGTAGAYIRVTTPAAVRDNYSCLGRETAMTGAFFFANAQSAGDFILVTPAQAYPGGDGYVLEFTFMYETT